MTDGFCDSKKPNIVSSPQRLPGPLRIVELEAQQMTNLTHTHINEIGIPTVLESSIVQIESSLISKQGGTVTMQGSVMYQQPT